MITAPVVLTLLAQVLAPPLRELALLPQVVLLQVGVRRCTPVAQLELAPQLLGVLVHQVLRAGRGLQVFGFGWHRFRV